MKNKILLALALIVGTASPSMADFCPGCIQNSASPQEAQINIGTAAVRGTLAASTGTFTWANIANLVIGNLSGNGSAVTNLNASNLASGVVAAARLAGSYTGITAVGTLASGLWNGSPIGTQYGGTGQNFVTASTGTILYFDGPGSMAALAPGSATYLLQSNGASAAPSYTHAPAVLGTNVTGIPLANLSSGMLPSNVAVNDVSLSTVSASKVYGNIAGGASFLTAPLPVGNLAAGQLPTSNPASSITATGVSPGTYGGPTQMAQIHVLPDGRIDNISQFSLAVPPPIISTGALPIGVTIGAPYITSGTLSSSVVASSITGTGAIPGSYGDATRTVTAVVQSDGRLSSISQQLISMAPSQITAGALPGNVSIHLASLSSGTLASNIMASSVTNSGVAPGTYGSSTQVPQIVVGADGRVTSASQFAVSALSSSTVSNNIDNNWSHAQTSQSSWTIHADLSASAVTATSLAGPGTGITSLSPSSIVAGIIPGDVVASSVGVNTINDSQVTAGANIAQSKISGLTASISALSASTAAIVAQKGAANGIATLDGATKIPVAQLPSAVMSYLGAWDAAVNSPYLANGDGGPDNSGDLYRVSVQGSTAPLASGATFYVGDFIIYNGSIWERSPAADGVTMVNAKIGAVVLVTDDIAEGGSPVNLWFTNALAVTALTPTTNAIAASTTTLFSVKASTGINSSITNLNGISTITATGRIAAGGFYTVGATSAAYFYGNGSALTGISGGGETNYWAAAKTFGSSVTNKNAQGFIDESGVNEGMIRAHDAASSISGLDELSLSVQNNLTMYDSASAWLSLLQISPSAGTASMMSNPSGVTGMYMDPIAGTLSMLTNVNGNNAIQVAAGKRVTINSGAGDAGAALDVHTYGNEPAIEALVHGDQNQVGLRITAVNTSISTPTASILFSQNNLTNLASIAAVEETYVANHGLAGLRFYTDRGDGSAFVGKLTEAMRLAGNGNVGIGTTTPSALLDVNGAAVFGVGSKSTMSATGSLTLANSAALNLSGAAGNIITQSSITASSFFGDGAGLTNVGGGGETNYYANAKTFGSSVTAVTYMQAQRFRADDNAGNYTYMGSIGGNFPLWTLSSGIPNFTHLQATGDQPLAVFMVGNSGSMSMGVDNSAGVEAGWGPDAHYVKTDGPYPLLLGANNVPALAVTADNQSVVIGTGAVRSTFTANGSIIAGGSITASAFFGDGSGLTNVGGGGETNYYANAKTFGSSVTVLGIVQASTFNAVGTAYQSNGVTVIDGQRNVTAASLTTPLLTFSTNTAMTVPVGPSSTRPGTPTAGALRFNSSNVQFEGYDGTGWTVLVTTPVTVSSGTCTGTGGVVVSSGGYCIHTFSTSDTFTKPITTGTVEVLIVAAGGGGGEGSGGGGGGLLYFGISPVGATTSITIGAGGVGTSVQGGSGNDTIFGSSIAFGGGGGGDFSVSGSTGGSGGGGGISNGACTYGGAGTIGQGFDGGGNGCNVGGTFPGGGGGGCGGIGSDAPDNATPGNGGIGLSSSLSGTPVGYCGGGGGGSYTAGTGGTAVDGGGAGSNSGVGANGTLGGGGGGPYAAASANGGNGGDGIVVVRYPNQ